MAGRVMAWTAQERTHAVVLLLLVVLYGAHLLVWCFPQPWYIEDAAITFAYARNLVDGEGLVPWHGGPPVEGYSNALWMYLLAACAFVRLDPWIMAKVLGFLFGAGTIVLTYALGRRARPGSFDAAPLFAPALLAGSTQFALWTGSGLENGLFSFLLVLGTWRTAVEIQDGDRRPVSAVAFFLLSMTRPDGLMYAAIGFLARLVGTLRERQWAALPLWLLAFGLPWGAYNAWRYDYFGWWYPNTYYAKTRNTNLLGWSAGGWKQLREWTNFYLLTYTIPFVVLALTGWQRRLRVFAAVLLAILAVFLLWNGRDYLPGWTPDWWVPTIANRWSEFLVWFLLGSSVLLGLVTLVRPGWEVRAVLWASFCAGVFFWVWSGVEWMKGYRWGSLIAVPLFTLIGLGFGRWVARVPAWATVALAGVYAGLHPKMPGLPWEQAKKPLLNGGVVLKIPVPELQWVALVAVALLLVLLAWAWEGRGRRPVPARPVGHLVLVLLVLAIPSIPGSIKLATSPETSPNSVHRRVNYMRGVQERLGLEEVTLLDVDMGAHMWWAADWRIGDMAGLVDVPFGHHIKYPKAFVDDYVFEELNPDFAHVHGSWAKTTKIPQNPKWKQRYIEIPGYASGGRSLHVGNHVRRDHLVGERHVGPEGRRVMFEGGVVLEGWEVPAPVVAAGGKLSVETTWRVLDRRGELRVLLFLADAAGRVHSAEVEPGYGWYRPDRWKPGEHVYGRWSIPLPGGLAPGSYDLGFVVIDQATGTVLPALPPSEPGLASPPATPVFMVGESRAAGVVTVGTVEQAMEAANRVYEGALALAATGDCEEAGREFSVARRHVARNEVWYQNRLTPMNEARVQCLVRRASGLADPIERAEVLAVARRIDHHHEGLVAACEPLGAELEALGDIARADEDWEAAFRAYTAATEVSPFRVQARRKAEEARNQRLGLKEDGTEPPKRGTSPKKPEPEEEVDQGGER